MNLKLAAFAFAGATSALLGTASTATSQDATPAEKPQHQRLTAKFVAEAPKLDAEADWGADGKISVMTGYGKMGNVPVTMQARTDGESVYIKASWYDATYSVAKKEWVWNEDGGWSQGKQDEDRFAIAFNINTPAFAEKGCLSMCHTGDDSRMGTHNEGELGDLWHWKAARGGRFGYADEQGFSADVDNGRGSDDGKSAYGNNKADDAPARIWAEGADKFGPFNDKTSIEMPADYKPTKGETVPGYILRTPEGSRADVESVAMHKNGFWTVVMNRKLVTDDANDVKFEAGKAVLFAASLMDNTGVHESADHTKSKPVELFIEAKK
ncbi:ethylbenzene dehydrogenase-related protein [Planctomycetota bacterium]|nr:ethylbenzene dehydrogenase-related protein [Planctomycetota bacterium]